MYISLFKKHTPRKRVAPMTILRKEDVPLRKAMQDTGHAPPDTYSLGHIPPGTFTRYSDTP